MRTKTNDKSRAKNRYSRVVQVIISGKLLKSFDEEVAREESAESTTGRDLIQEALKARADRREKKNPFFQ